MIDNVIYSDIEDYRLQKRFPEEFSVCPNCVIIDEENEVETKM